MEREQMVSAVLQAVQALLRRLEDEAAAQVPPRL